MTNNISDTPRNLAEAAKVLRSCQPLAERLSMEGITVNLTEDEQALLLKFEQLLQTDFTDSDWSYLRIVSGVKQAGVAVLTSCLNRYRNTNEKFIYGQL